VYRFLFVTYTHTHTCSYTHTHIYIYIYIYTYIICLCSHCLTFDTKFSVPWNRKNTEQAKTHAFPAATGEKSGRGDVGSSEANESGIARDSRTNASEARAQFALARRMKPVDAGEWRELSGERSLPKPRNRGRGGRGGAPLGEDAQSASSDASSSDGVEGSDSEGGDGDGGEELSNSEDGVRAPPSKKIKKAMPPQ
jgi:hypothetical protein